MGRGQASRVYIRFAVCCFEQLLLHLTDSAAHPLPLSTLRGHIGGGGGQVAGWHRGEEMSKRIQVASRLAGSTGLGGPALFTCFQTHAWACMDTQGRLHELPSFDVWTSPSGRVCMCSRILVVAVWRHAQLRIFFFFKGKNK